MLGLVGPKISYKLGDEKEFCSGDAMKLER